MSRYAFYFDASGCSGCKACQVACKDRNGLEIGLLWRRVYEVSGGSWERQGEAWQQDVYAYNLSVACNHCERAVCAEACPTQAIRQREDGIVLIDADRCIGCKYCSWACPYGAPQYDLRAKSMTKCTFCVEDVEAGLAPACVAACPLRVLDFGDQAELEQGQAVQSVAPLPEAEMTGPALFIQPHRDASRAEQPPGRVANREEVQTGKKSSEIPLVVFTILAQMAVGAFIVLGAFTWWVWGIFGMFYLMHDFFLGALLPTGVVYVVGVLASLLHLGQPLKAHQASINIRTSWLSREIFLVGLFGVGWVIFCGTLIATLIFYGFLQVIYGLTSLAGLALIYCMVRIYQKCNIPGWRSWITPVSFFMSAGILGFLFIGMLIAPDIHFFDLHATGSEKTLVIGIILVLVLIAFDLALQDRHATGSRYGNWPELLRLMLSIAAMLPLAIILADIENPRLPVLLALSFGLALGAQLIGRYLFYERLNERTL